jgi:hypothetical protein
MVQRNDIGLSELLTDAIISISSEPQSSATDLDFVLITCCGCFAVNAALNFEALHAAPCEKGCHY